MKKRICIIALALWCFAIAAAQVPPSAISKRYFSNGELVQLHRQAAEKLFDYYKMPKTVFAREYAFMRNPLVPAAAPAIIKGFRELEKKTPDIGTAPTGSAAFLQYKKQYDAIVDSAVRNAILNNKDFRKKLGFPESDRYTHYDVTVQVQPDGRLLVEERLSVYNGNSADSDPAIKAAGGGNNDIKRGIYRTFPTKYVGDYKLFYNTTIKVLDVRRDGKPEPWTEQKKYANGTKIQIGKADYLLPKGNYVYTIKYETQHQLKHLGDLDELYWNVTGSDVMFRTDSVTCTLILPVQAEVVSNDFYTGRQGETGKDGVCLYSAGDDGNRVVFKTTRPLLPGEGFTVASSWKKGLVARPTPSDKFWWMLKNNQVAFLFPLLIVCMIIYYSIVWRRVGKDPQKGVIVPQFYPPADLSPAAMGYIYRQKFDYQLTSATLVDLAVKRKIKIEVDKEGLIFKSNVYRFTAGEAAAITEEDETTEKKVKPKKSTYYDFGEEAEDLFGETIQKGKYNSELAGFNTAIQDYCKKNYQSPDGNPRKIKKGYFMLNGRYMTLFGVLIFLLLVYLLFFVALPTASVNPWQFAWLGAGFIVSLIVQWFFARIIKAYTLPGRIVMDIIEGFRMYLRAADAQRINAMNPPEKTLNLYETYMPYAIALDCESEWSDQFEAVIKAAAVSGATSAAYHSNMFSRDDFSASSFSSSFAGAISSASTPPSSSSGSGSSGGGSSGGGGGGGGSGGW